MLAAAEGRIGILKIILDSKPDAELKDDDGCTAIDHAVINNNNKLSFSYFSCIISTPSLVALYS